MNILVCISKTPDTTAKIAFRDNNSAFDTNGVQFILNPYDEWYSLVRALELVEENGGEVVVVTVGDSSTEPVIRKALAIGAHKAVRINAEPESSQQVAQYISNYAKDKGFDIIFGGKETIDFNSGATPSMIAAYLKLPYLALVNKLEKSGENLIAYREIDGGVEKVEVGTPVVLSSTKGIAEQRIPNMRGIMMAKRKPLETIEPNEDFSSSVTYVNFDLPEGKGDCTFVDATNMDELVRLLHEEAQVI